MTTPLIKFPLFRDLDPAILELLDPLARPFRYAPDTGIFEQGEPAEFLYLLNHGLVDIRYKPYDGETLIVTRITTGGVFGWSAVIGSKTYSSGAVSVEPSEGWRIFGNDLRGLCKKDPQSTQKILDRLATIVSARWQDAHDQVRAMLAQGMSQAGR